MIRFLEKKLIFIIIIFDKKKQNNNNNNRNNELVNIYDSAMNEFLIFINYVLFSDCTSIAKANYLNNKDILLNAYNNKEKCSVYNFTRN